MEAMPIGVPVIATNIAGTSKFVEHGVTGLLVRPSDNDAFDDFSLRLRIAEAARQKVINRFDAVATMLSGKLLTSKRFTAPNTRRTISKTITTDGLQSQTTVRANSARVYPAEVFAARLPKG